MPEDQLLFLCERSCFTALCEGLHHPCPCDWPTGVWDISSIVQVNYLCIICKCTYQKDTMRFIGL